MMSAGVFKSLSTGSAASWLPNNSTAAEMTHRVTEVPMDRERPLWSSAPKFWAIRIENP